MSATPHNGRTNAVRGAARLPAVRSHGLSMAILLAVAYCLGVRFGFWLTPATSPVALLWPPNAILLAALLLTPPRRWWLPVTAVLPAHFASELALGVPWNMASLWFTSNVVEALLGATLILRVLGRPPDFRRVHDALVFILGAVLTAPLLSSFLDTAFVAFTGWRFDGYWEAFATRLFSNSLAALTLVPPILIWSRERLSGLLRGSGFRRFLELLAVFGGIGPASFLIFQNVYSTALSTILYVPLPFLIWAALRYGVIGVNLCAAIVIGFAIAAVLEGPDPSAMRSQQSAVQTVQTFLLISQASLMLLAASFSELRRSKEDLARKGERLNLALRSAEIGTWDWDLGNDRVTWRLTREKDASGPRTRSHPAAQLLEMVHESDRSPVLQAFHDAVRRRGSAEIECRFVVGRHHFSRWISARGRVLADSQGHPVRMIGVFVDTTERKNQELQDRVHREQLAHLGRVSILGELSGAIAHELNQPLTSILLNAQAALCDLNDPSSDPREIAESLREIVEEDKRAGEVIRRLRALLLHGAVEMKPLNLKQCIEEVLLLEHNDLATRNIVTELKLETPGPWVMGDRVQLEQVLLNLVVNARDAMADNPADDRPMAIETAVTDGMACIRISDAGPGIPDLEMIFEPFYSTKGHGIGMGLAICRSIIAAHGGRIWASNNAARGATFHVCMPPLAVGAGAAPAESRSSGDQGPTRVLTASSKSSPSTGLRK